MMKKNRNYEDMYLENFDENFDEYDSLKADFKLKEKVDKSIFHAI